MFNIFNSGNADVDSDDTNKDNQEQEQQSEGTTFGGCYMGDAQPKDIPRKEQ